MYSFFVFHAFANNNGPNLPRAIYEIEAKLTPFFAAFKFLSNCISALLQILDKYQLYLDDFLRRS